MFLVVSCSLDPGSRSRILARMAARQLQTAGHDVELLDLRETALPWCDAETCYDHDNVRHSAALVRRARGVLLATPIYNYNVNAAAKNLVELTGRAWQDQVVGFLCAAGGKTSYMSVMGLANSLILDFRCVILPRFVYATGDAFRDDDLHDEKMIERLNGLCSELVRIGSLLRAE